MQEIADELTEEGVEFYLESRLWNKNKVFRIIENEKYIGAEGYPAIIGLEEYQKANQRKSARGNQKIALDAEVEYLKKITVCAQCGKPFYRRTKWKNRENGFVRTGVKTTSISPMWRCLEGYCRQSVWLQRNPMRCYQRKRL